MSEFTFSICHPTARIDPLKPLWWGHAAKAFYDACSYPFGVQYVLVVHQSNRDLFLRENRGMIDWALSHWGEFVLVCNHGPNTGNHQGHLAGMRADGDILVGVMDDLSPCEAWDSEILKATGFSGLSPAELEAVIHVSSGSPSDKELFNPIILTKKRRERYGYCLHPAYESMFSDNEFTEVAIRDRVVIDAMHIKFEHRHPVFGTADMDDVYRQQNRREAYEYGWRVFQARKALGFPPDPNWKLPECDATRKLIVLVFPGENFPAEVVASIVGLSLWASNSGYHMQVHQGHTTNCYVTRAELAKGVIELPLRADYVFWQDDDNVTTAPQLAALIADLDARPDLDGVVGWCWCDRNDGKDRGKAFVMSCGRQGGGPVGEGLPMLPLDLQDLEKAEEDPLIPIDYSGFPCVLLRGETMRRLGPEAFTPIVRPDVNFGFLSEDASFFLRAKEAGMKFAVDLRVKVPHLKLRAIEPQIIRASDINWESREFNPLEAVEQARRGLASPFEDLLERSRKLAEAMTRDRPTEVAY